LDTLIVISLTFQKQPVAILCCRSPRRVFNIQAAQCQQNWTSLRRWVCVDLWRYIT